jgi:hypothetical protein
MTTTAQTAPPSLQTRVGGAVSFLLGHVNNGPTLATNASRWGRFFFITAGYGGTRPLEVCFFI